jgi:hypothetical protein
MAFEQNHDNKTTVVMAPVLRASWARERAWHGETVTIRVRSANVQLGSALELRIGAVGTAAFATLAPLALQAGKLDHNYTIDWRTLAVPPGSTDFEVVARLPAYNLDSAPSAPMKVDLLPPLFSA